MGQLQSKSKLLYQAAKAGRVHDMVRLRKEGASLEWTDMDGKTPLAVACMKPELIHVAQILIQLGRDAGTPLHHAAKRDLDQTVKLLLSLGANALLRNDDGHTPLDVARMNWSTSVVRAIENHICRFSGWLRLRGPRLLPELAPRFFLSRKIWVVIIPCGSANPMEPPRFELAIYSTLQDAQPRTLVPLWKVKIEEPKFHQPDPSLAIFDQSTSNFQQLNLFSFIVVLIMPLFCLICKLLQCSFVQVHMQHWKYTMITNCLDMEVLQCSRLPLILGQPASKVIMSKPLGIIVDGWMDAPTEKNDWGVPDSRPTGKQSHHVQNLMDPPLLVPTSVFNASVSSAPSAPPIPEDVLGEEPIIYPSIYLNQVDTPAPASTGDGASKTNDDAKGGDSSSCIICWEAPIEGACIPCGHMAGCMSCLRKIKAEKGICPVCRGKTRYHKIDQVIRLYAV
ncbi:hypothetical protein PTKIN_Ptkin15bG0121100 [Pterospermum kingtungense]